MATFIKVHVEKIQRVINLDAIIEVVPLEDSKGTYIYFMGFVRKDGNMRVVSTDESYEEIVGKIQNATSQVIL